MQQQPPSTREQVAQQPSGGAQQTGQQAGGTSPQMAGGTQRTAGGTQQTGTTQQVGQASQQPAGQATGGQQTGLALQDVETPQQRAAVDDVARAIQVCEWCADQCIGLADPNMTECIRLCEDVSELGEAALVLVPRNSRYAGTVLGAFDQAIRACAQECSRHTHAHCQECAQVLGQASQSIQQLLGPSGGQGPTGMQ